MHDQPPTNQGPFAQAPHEMHQSRGRPMVQASQMPTDLPPGVPAPQTGLQGDPMQSAEQFEAPPGEGFQQGMPDRQMTEGQQVGQTETAPPLDVQFGQSQQESTAPEALEMETGVQAEAQNTYTAMTGYLSGNQTVYRWHGGWHPNYTVFYSARPRTAGRSVRGSVYYVYKTSDGNLWYRLQIQNLSSSGTYYDVRASYEYSTS